MKLDLKLEIEPYQGIAGIRFGMTTAQIHNLLSDQPTPFRRTTDSDITEQYSNLGIQINYNADGCCQAIELTAHATPTFKGKPLLGKPFAEICTWLQAIDSKIETDETGLTSHQLGIGLYAPFAQSHPQDPIESVILFTQGYYYE